MPDSALFYMVIIAMLTVVAVLMTGIGGFARGGAFNRKHGNRMMRWRIIAQAIAIALIVLLVTIQG